MEVVLGVIVVLAFFALIAVGASVQGPARVRARRHLPPRPPDRPEGARPDPADPVHRPHGQGRPADGDPEHPAAGGDHPRQRPRRVNAVAYFRVIDPSKAIVEVENYLLATSQISQTALRSVLGKAEFDQLLSERERLNEELQKIIDESTEPWGVKVTAVEIKDVEIPEQMQRAIARQAEAERERRAKIINSEGEFQAAQKLTDAADIISTNPASLQLRYLQTLLEIGSNQNTTVVFPLPMDMLEPFLGRGDHKAGGSKAKPPTTGAAPHHPRPRRRARFPTTSPPRGPELPRDTHRPAERAEDDPRPRPRRAPGQLRLAEGGGAGRGPENCPFCEGREDRTPPELLRPAPGRRRGRQPRLADPGGAEPLPGAGRAAPRFGIHR